MFAQLYLNSTQRSLARRQSKDDALCMAGTPWLVPATMALDLGVCITGHMGDLRSHASQMRRLLRRWIHPCAGDLKRRMRRLSISHSGPLPFEGLKLKFCTIMILYCIIATRPICHGKPSGGFANKDAGTRRASAAWL